MNRSQTRRLAAVIVIAFFFIPLLFPFYIMVVTSIKTLREVYTFPPTFLPQVIQWQNWLQVWETIPLFHFLVSSSIIASAATFLTLVCTMPAAYALARLRFPGRKAYLRVILITQMLSPIVIIIPLFRLAVFFKLVDSYGSLIIFNAAFSLSFAIWLMTSYFQSIPVEIEEAAMVDGCTRLGVLGRVTLPLAWPGVVTVVIFVFVTAWNEFLMAQTLLMTSEMKPIPVGLFSLIGKYKVEWNLLSAGVIIGTIPTLVLFMLIQRQIVKGLTMGAVK
jgi:multiple sugar transport system permease protein